MFNKLSTLRKERPEGEKGFTLIELLVVVVIIGILIAIAIPLYLNYKKGANDKAAQSDVRNAVAVMEQCNSDNSSVYPSAVSSAGVITGCGTVTQLNLSSNTTLGYAATSPNFKIVGTNTGGSGKWWCYNSATGGSVRDVSGGATILVAAALTACT